MISRRDILNLGALACVPLPGLSPGPKEEIWIAVTHNGVDISPRTPVDFFWNTSLVLDMDLADHATSPIPLTGSNAYLSQTTSTPFRSQSWEPFVVRAGDRLRITWTFRVDDKYRQISLHDPRVCFRP